MELIKKNIHFNRTAKEARNQITIEEDVNIPDTKEDIESILFHNYRINIEDVKTGEQKVHIKGKILYSILYCSEESGRLCCMESSIPIDEQLYMDGISVSDKVMVKPQIEDFSVGIINSRKISIQAILELCACVQELYDEQITTGIQDIECEIQKKECDFTQLAVCTKDIFRFRESINLPNNMPNVENIVFSSIKVQDVQYKPMDGQISMQGKVCIFVIYDGERDSSIQMYQTTLPFNTMLDCSGSNLNMTSQISYDIIDSQLHLDEDLDGENRSFLVEFVLELDIKLYEAQKVGVLWDLYGIQKELTPNVESVTYDLLRDRQRGNTKVSDRIKFSDEEKGQVKIIHADGKCVLENYEVTQEGIKINGMLICQVLYMTGREDQGYGSTQCIIPINMTVDMPMMNTENTHNMTCSVNLLCNDLQFATDMEGNMEAKANILYDVLLFEKMTGRNISGVSVKDPNMEKYNNLPSMAVYFAKQGDTLWEMGKKYCVPIRQISEMNHLSAEELPAGERVLIVRGLQG